MCIEYQDDTSVKKEIASHLQNGEYIWQNCISALHTEIVKLIITYKDEWSLSIVEGKTKLNTLCNSDEFTCLQ